MTEHNEIHSRYPVDMVAFVVALIGAPLVVAVLGFWAALVPVFAVPFGAIPYLLFGAPLFFLNLQRHGANSGNLISIGLYANGLIPIALIPIALLNTMDLETYLNLNYFLVGFGALFGPLWAWVFGSIYRYLQNDFYAQPL